VGRVPTAAYPTGVAVSSHDNRLVWLSAKGLATPMYDLFTTRPALTPYTAVKPEQPLTELNGTAAAAADPVGAALPFDQVDLVPQELSGQVLWRSVYGAASAPPAPGPNASAAERFRAQTVLQALRQGTGHPHGAPATTTGRQHHRQERRLIRPGPS
jgi:hypothetical protein